MLADNRREQVPTRAQAYGGQVRVRQFAFEGLPAYQDWRSRARQTVRQIFRKQEFLLWITGNHLGVLPVYDELAQHADKTLVVQLDAHHCVVVEKPSGALPIRAYTSYDRSQVNDNIRSAIFIQANDVCLLDQIVFRPGRRKNCRGLPVLDLRHNVFTKKTSSTCDQNALVGPEAHGRFLRFSC